MATPFTSATWRVTAQRESIVDTTVYEQTYDATVYDRKPADDLAKELAKMSWQNVRVQLIVVY
jgi:hypothetical protein